MKERSVLARLGVALLVSVLAGVALALVALPVVGAPALAVKSTSDDFLKLPAVLTAEQPPTRTRILAADGSLLATLYLQNRVNVPLSAIPVSMQHAIVAIEDSRFYHHNGIDVKGTLRALVRNSSTGGVQQGGSTLTQQYVKNALLASRRGNKAGEQAATAQTVQRKLQEARYALALEQQLSKGQILNRYLNIAYFGNGAYGVGAAAQYYWGIPVQKLSLAQSALLAGMVQNPSRFDPTDASKRTDVLDRRGTVLQRMQDLGYISAAQRSNASHTPLGLAIHPVGNGCDDPAVVGAGAAFYCDYVRHELEDTDVGKALGSTLAERQSALLGGGLVIRTSLDRTDLKAANDALAARAPFDGRARAAADTVEPGTGWIKSLAVNAVYGSKPGQTKVNFATGGNLGFQAGSTFKPFVLAAALEQGIPTSLTLYSPQKYTSTKFVTYDPKTHVRMPYPVFNAGDSEAGTFDMVQATADSVNTYYLQLEERTGTEKPAAIAESMGVRWISNPDRSGHLGRGASFVLGAYEVSPLDMAAAYATFASHGTHCTPQAVMSITDGSGRPLAVPQPQCAQVLDPGIADQVTTILKGVIDGPSPTRTGIDASIGRPAAGKTGTTDNSTAAWFDGYTPQLSTSVWVGQPDPKTGAPQRMQDVNIGGYYYKQVFGGTVPAAIWQRTMSAAENALPYADFTAAPLAVASTGPQTTVPDLRGQSPSQATATLQAAGFTVADGGPVSGQTYVPSGTVCYTAPTRGSFAAQGSVVTIYENRG